MSIYITDSNSGLSYKTVKELGMEFIEIPFKINDKKAKLTKNFNFEAFFNEPNNVLSVKLKKDDYIKFFEPILKMGENIVYLHCLADFIDVTELKEAVKSLKEKYALLNITLLDTRAYLSGAAVIVYETGLRVKSGIEEKSIISWFESFREKVGFYFTVNSLSSNALLKNYANSLTVKPVLYSCNGKTVLIEKCMGRKKALQQILERIKTEGWNVADYAISITYANNLNEAINLKQQILSEVGNAKILFERISLSMCEHFKDNLLGVGVHVKK